MFGQLGGALASKGSDAHTIYEKARETYRHLIVPGCAPFGMKPVRADDIAEPGDIPLQIFLRLRDSDLVLADLTSGNANVLYELGLRHAQGKVTIQIGEHGRLPFDVNTIRTISFVRSDEGYSDAVRLLRNAIRSALTDGMLPVTATRVFRRSDSRIKFIPTILDLSRRPSLPDVNIEIDSAIEDIGHRLRSVGDNLGAIGSEFGSARSAALLLASAAVGSADGPAQLWRDLRHSVEPLVLNLREENYGVERSVARIDRALNVGLSLLRTPKDREVLQDWRRKFLRLSKILGSAGEKGVALQRLAQDSLGLFMQEETDSFEVLVDAAKLSRGWLTGLNQTLKMARPPSPLPQKKKKKKPPPSKQNPSSRTSRSPREPSISGRCPSRTMRRTPR